MKWQGGALRRTLRNKTLGLLSKTINIQKDAKGIQFLFFHHLYMDEVENAALIIEWLAENFKVISYSEAVARVINNNIDDYYLCFSSDDGLKNNLKAAELFNRYGISCCFFINPTTISNRDINYHHTICTERYGLPVTETLTWAEVDQLLKEGHEIGNHSYDHRIQSSLDRTAFVEDLRMSDQMLREQIGVVKHFAYPRGGFQHFKEEYLPILFEQGYESCGTAVRGCHILQPKTPERDKIALRRDVFVFHEPLSHVQYFIAKAQQTGKIQNTYWGN